MPEKILVLVLRREPDLNEIAAIQRKFPGKQLVFKTINPADYKEHAAICEEMKPDVVLLPKDRPIPSLAMEKGFPHVALFNGDVMELLPLMPQFKPFESKRRP